ncbi:hypothetical protein EPN29_11665 [bacterium]|nr:MAG: hypothetical protein EPN29_11665 [bacterium]
MNVALLAVVPLVLAGCGSSDGSAPSTPGVTSNQIVIGSDMALTGPGSATGQGFKLGLELAASEINAHGGINGRKVKLVIEDDAGTAQGGVEAARRLVQQDGVFADFAGAGSTSAVSEAPFFTSSKVPLYATLASDPRIFQPFSRYVFTGVPQRRDLSQEVVKYAQSIGAATLDILYASDQAFCQSGVQLVQGDAAASGTHIVGLQSFHSGDTDFTAQISSVARLNPSAVYLCGLDVDGGRIVPQLRRVVADTTIIADASMATAALLKTAGPAGEGVRCFWLSSSQPVTAQTGAMGDWNKRLDKFAPNRPAGTPNIFTVSGYVDFYVFAEALRHAGSSVTRDNFVDALEGVHNFVPGRDSYFSYAAPIGVPRNFSKENHQGTHAAVPIEIKNGEFVTIEPGS